MNVYWAWTERKPGVFDWNAIDYGLKRLSSANMNVLLTLNGPVPCWVIANDHKSACTSPQWTVPPSEQWTSFVEAIVKRYSHQVRFWEIWNEPDLVYSINFPDPHERLVGYRDKILVPGARAIHRVDPGAKVLALTLAAMVSGGTAPGPLLEQALSFVLGGDAGVNVDVLSFHSYFPVHVSDKAASAHKAMEQVGFNRKPIWVTELGVERSKQTYSSATDAQGKQAELLEEAIKETLDSGKVDKVFWFALTDSPTESGEHRNEFGLINNRDYKSYEWAPRPAYIALQNMVRSACK